MHFLIVKLFSFGAGPIGITDPYEDKWITVSDSGVPDSGQGVFALREIPKGRCASMYTGLIYNAGQVEANPNNDSNLRKIISH